LSKAAVSSQTIQQFDEKQVEKIVEQLKAYLLEKEETPKNSTTFLNEEKE